VDDCRSSLDRDELIEVLHAENVLARKYFWPGCHRMQPYKALFPNAGLLLRNTEKKAAQIMVLPMGQCVSKKNIADICDIIREALTNGQSIRNLLRQKRPVNHTCLAPLP